MKRMAIVLAAGKGKRMKSKLYKVLHPVCGKPMVGHVLDAVERVCSERTVVVVGHGAKAVQNYLGHGMEFALQMEQLGTGHAVKQAKPFLEGEEGVTLVICGDTPLITAETLTQLIELHVSAKAAATILTATLENPAGYGRVICNKDGSVLKIVEQKDCTPQEKLVELVNTGTYCFDNAKLFASLDSISNKNAQHEYYLTDVIGILKAQGETIHSLCTDGTDGIGEWLGVNDRVALSEAENVMRQRINKRHMLNGVTMINSAQTYIEADVEIGSDTVLEPGTSLKGRTIIGANCIIGSHTEMTDCFIGERVHIRQSVLQEAVVGSDSSVGPFAYLRPNTRLGTHVKVGDFVEIKNASLDDYTKVSHLSYIGDARIGKNVNIGCGAITVNYDGFNKSVTEIADDAFIGSNVNLIAPIHIGKGAYIVAGSTITNAVSDNELAIARERQVNKPGYADKIRARAKAKKERES